MNTRQKWTRLWRLAQISPKAVSYKLAGKDEELYTLVCDLFLELGGIYVKFLQGVLLQSDVMKKWQGDNKYKVFESVPISDINLHEVLVKELKQEPMNIFSSFEVSPFATGSFGQVYKGRLKTGENVIIKVLRPQIKRILKFDLRILGFIAKVFTTDFTSFDVSAKKAIADFKTMTLRETDYINEAKFAYEMSGVFKDDPYIIIPKTFLELCSTQMIIQEYVSGTSAAEIIEHCQKNKLDVQKYVFDSCGSDIRFQMTHLGTEVTYGFFTHSRMPGDLHPGNVKILPDNKIGIIDFGISARKPKVPNIFYSFLKQLTNVNEDGSSAGAMFLGYIKYFSYDLYLAFDKLDRQFSNQNQSIFNIIEAYAQKLFDKATGSNFNVKDIKYTTMFGAFVNKLVNENNRFAITTKINEVELLRGIQTLVSLIDTLEERQAIEDIFKAVYERVGRDLPEFTRTPTNPLSTHTAISTVDAWLARLALKNPELFIQIRSYISKSKSAKVG